MNKTPDLLKVGFRRFSKWRLPATRAAYAMCDEVSFQLRSYERAAGLTTRARRADHAATFEAIIQALVCDLTHAYLCRHLGIVGVFLSRDTSIAATRYKAPCDSRTFPVILDRLIDTDWIERVAHGSHGRGLATQVTAGPRLVELIESYVINMDDLILDTTEEVVIQKTPKRKTRGQDELDIAIEYEDTETTIQYRSEVRRINAALDKAIITYLGPNPHDLTNRRMRRYFRTSFELGGRLFGGFWQEMSKHEVEDLRIDGQPVTEVDFTAMQVALARADLGVPHDPREDPYRIRGMPRKGVKSLIGAMFFATKPLRAWPEGMYEHWRDSGHTITTAQEGIREAFPEFAEKWYTGYGHHLQFLESQVLIKALLRLKDKDVPALPKHDCVIVPANVRVMAAAFMVMAFRAVTGGEVQATASDEEFDFSSSLG